MRSRLHESLGYWRFFLSVSIFCYIYFRSHFFRPALVVFLPSSPVRRSSRSLYLFRIQCMLHFKLDGLMRSSSTEWMGWVVSMLLASTWIEKSWIHPQLERMDESYCSEWDTEREKEARGEAGRLSGVNNILHSDRCTQAHNAFFQAVCFTAFFPFPWIVLDSIPSKPRVCIPFHGCAVLTVPWYTTIWKQ